MLTFGSLLIVLVIVSVLVRSQLHASKRYLPAAAASGVAPIAVDPNRPQQAVSQYQRELDKAMKASAQHTADQAASIADDGAR
jgi:anaerobic C4-dicarboxylate transporter